MKFIKSTIALSILLSACQTTNIKENEEIKNNLENKKLYISEVSNIKVPYYKNLHVVFKKNKKENKNFLSIYTGCNNTFADYKIEGDVIKIGLGKTTMMTCPDQDSQKLEAKINNIISKDLKINIEDDEIVFLNENKDYIKIKKYLK